MDSYDKDIYLNLMLTNWINDNEDNSKNIIKYARTKLKIKQKKYKFNHRVISDQKQ